MENCINMFSSTMWGILKNVEWLFIVEKYNRFKFNNGEIYFQQWFLFSRLSVRDQTINLVWSYIPKVRPKRLISSPKIHQFVDRW